MKPFVSIIIPYYKGKDFIRNFSLPSILNQKYDNYEVCIIDDGSQDDVEEIINKFKKENKEKDIRYFKSVINKGLGWAYNFGIKMAKYEYVAFLEQDDIWLPNKLEEQIEFMETKNLLASSTWCFELDLNSKKIIDIHIGALSGFIAKKKFFEIVGFFDENKSMLGAQDADLYMKFLISVYKKNIPSSTFYIFEKPLFIFVRHPGSLSSRSGNIVNIINRYKSLLEKYKMYEEINYKEIKNLISYWQSHLAVNYCLINKNAEAKKILIKSLKMKKSPIILMLYIFSSFPSNFWQLIYILWQHIKKIKGLAKIQIYKLKFRNEFMLAIKLIKNIPT